MLRRLPATVVTRLRRAAIPGLESNAAALMISSILTGVLGLVYWAVAERFFDTAVVGRASAVIATATMLASISCLSLGGSYQRFLPAAGRATTRLIVGGLAVVSGVALLLGTGFVLLGPAGDRLFANGYEAALFPLLVAALAIYALEDPILTGLRLARSVAAKNIALSVLKIAPLIIYAGSASAAVIAGSWGVLALLIALLALGHILRTGVRGRAHLEPRLPPTRQLWSFQGTFFVMALVLTLTPLVLPLIVISTLGPEQNAYFNLAWTMCTALGLARAAVGASFVVEASAPGADRAQLLRRLVRLLAPVTVVSAVGLAVAGPIALSVVGPNYLHEAGLLVVIMAVDALVAATVSVYFLVAQLERRLRLMLAVQCVIVALTIGGAWLLIPRVGLTGIGIASLTAQLTALVVVAGPLRRAIVRLRAEPVAPSTPTHVDPVLG